MRSDIDKNRVGDERVLIPSRFLSVRIKVGGRVAVFANLGNRIRRIYLVVAIVVDLNGAARLFGTIIEASGFWGVEEDIMMNAHFAPVIPSEAALQIAMPSDIVGDIQ